MFLSELQAAKNIGAPLLANDEATTKRRFRKLLKKANVPYTTAEGIYYIEPQYLYEIKEAMQCRSKPCKGKTRRIGGSEERTMERRSINPQEYLIAVK